MVVQTLTRALGRPPGEIFASIAPQPLASASIAQVYAVTLREPDGSLRELVVKVQRRRLRELVTADIGMLALAAELLQRLPRIRNANPRGIVAEFASPYELLEAVKAVRKAGFSKIDTHTPFPIHGMDKAMGLPGSKLPWLVLCGGLLGTASAIALQWWMNGYDYAYHVGGKPVVSYQAYVPIGFELTVLFSAFTAVLGMLAMNLLPQPYHPLFSHERFARVTEEDLEMKLDNVEQMRGVVGEACAL